MRSISKSLLCALVLAGAAAQAQRPPATPAPMPPVNEPVIIQSSITVPTTLLLPNGPPNPHPYLVGYLPVYKNMDWAAYMQKMDFTRMTHLNLAFVNPPKCDPAPCTAKSNMTFGARSLTDVNLHAIVAAAHAHGVKVLASLGGAGGDKNIMQFYNAGLTDPLVASLDAWCKKYNIDGVDADLEQPTDLGMAYTVFINKLASTFHPEGKLVTAAVAQYIQVGMQDAALKQFDIVNIMVYSTLDRGITALNYYADQKHIPKEKLTLGVAFFGKSKKGEKNYNEFLAAYPNAWAVDSVGGGTYFDGVPINYQGEATMKQEVLLGRQYGGIMIWELTGDDPGAPHSLLKVIQDNLN